MVLILLRPLPLPAMIEPVYASYKDVCSNKASRMAAVHWVREWKELKCRRYLFWPAEHILKMFFRDCAPWFLVGSVSS